MIAKDIIENKSNRADMDTPWKNILDRYFRGFMEYCLPNIANQIDWKRNYEMLEKELQIITRGAKIGNRIADKLAKVWTKDGRETWILVHLEVQGKKETNFPERMFIYRSRFRDYYKKPIISIAILVDGNARWRPNCFREDYYGCSLEMQYLVVKLLDYKEKRQELESFNHPFASVILAQLAVLETKNNPEIRLKTKIALTRALYRKGFEKQDVLELYALIDWLIRLPKALEIDYHKEVEHIEEEKKVRYITTAERIGIKKGLKKGFQKGEMAILLRQFQLRFPNVSNTYLERIQKADATSLLAWGEKILYAGTPEEVFSAC